jgi:hypothetical protein
MWEISENLHRTDLTKLERAEQIKEWIELAKKGKVQSAEVRPNESKRADGRGHRPESGISAAARELGVPKTSAHVAEAIASLSEEAKQEAVVTRLSQIDD